MFVFNFHFLVIRICFEFRYSDFGFVFCRKNDIGDLLINEIRNVIMII
jgi:hypothetical protein